MVVAVDRDGERIVRLARSWIGTPYRHQASLKGIGADCLGLIRGLWREAVGPEPTSVPPYSRFWSESRVDEPLWRGLRTCFETVVAPNVGDVLLFRMIEGSAAKHVAVLASSSVGFDTVIHAYSGRSVVETSCSDALRRRMVAAFRFPERN